MSQAAEPLDLAADGKPVEHPECARRATLIPAPDAPCYETILDTPEDQRANLPARFHTPVWEGNATPNAWLCAVCWGDGWVTRWPCATAAAHGADVFTPEHLATRAAADVPALLARVRELEAENERLRVQARELQIICAVCAGPVGYIDCPTGGWWAHADHPTDGHDAEPVQRAPEA
jgi:hypothetical protein